MGKKHAKIGKKPGKPAYRTPSDFKYKQSQKITKQKARNYKK